MDQKTIDTYNQLAKEYDKEVADFWKRFPSSIIEEFAGLVHGRVLDVGSGSGRDGIMLQKRGLDIVCLDASEAMVKISSAKGLSSIAGDFNALPFRDQEFDGVWAYTSLLHVPKSEIGNALTEIWRVIKPNGFLGLGLIEGEGERYRESAGIGRPRWLSFYKKGEVEELLKLHGFENFHFEQFQVETKTFLNFIARKIVLE